MSTPPRTTPALARATEALNRAQEVDGPEDMTLAEKAARIAVSAALHDPDDPDSLAKVLAEVDGWGDLWGDLAEVRNRHLDGRREAYRRRADAVRAAILGEAS